MLGHALLECSLLTESVLVLSVMGHLLYDLVKGELGELVERGGLF